MVTREKDRIFEEVTIQNGPAPVHVRRILQSPEEMLNKGKIFNHTYIEKGAGIGWHIHKGTCECYYILKGEGLYNDNGTEMIVRAGDVTFTNDGEGHSLINRNDETLEVIALVLNT